MRKPFNALLACLAANDGLAELMYLLHYIHGYLPDIYGHRFICTRFYTISLYIMDGLVPVQKAMNVWLTLFIAFIRYKSISRMSNSALLTYTKVVIIVLASVVLSTHIYIPYLFVPKDMFTVDNCLYIIYPNDDLIPDKVLHYTNAAILSITTLLLIILSFMIIFIVCKAEKTRRQMSSSTQSRSSARQKTSRLTYIILLMVAVSFLDIIPSNVLLLWDMGVVNYDFYIVNLFRALMNLFKYLNYSTNIIFYLISVEFRTTLVSVITCKMRMR